jgi:hypothetical protein
MIELHSNFTFKVRRPNKMASIPPSTSGRNHRDHSALTWFETGLYIFTAVQPDGGWQWVGDHIRPRVAIRRPGNGLSALASRKIRLSAAVFFHRHVDAQIRPIIDKKLDKWYLSFNPVDKSFKVKTPGQAGFSPNFKFSYDVTPKIAAGMEYYGAPGHRQLRSAARTAADSAGDRFDLSPKWEINFGVGVGVTHGTDTCW